jgi:hypothetical protein
MHHVLVHQQGHHLREQRVQRRAVIGAKIRQQAMIDPTPPPLKLKDSIGFIGVNVW